MIVGDLGGFVKPFFKLKKLRQRDIVANGLTIQI